jgi:CelD/BcsL family acetyltransferase involved in cellulose biosynthesis
MMKAAEAHNIKRIDLGKGDADYKSRLMTGATAILEGSIVPSVPVRFGNACWRLGKACLRGAPLRWAARRTAAWLRRR